MGAGGSSPSQMQISGLTQTLNPPSPTQAKKFFDSTSSGSAFGGGAKAASTTLHPNGAGQPVPLNEFMARFLRQRLSRPVHLSHSDTAITVSVDRKGEADDYRIRGQVGRI